MIHTYVYNYSIPCLETQNTAKFDGLGSDSLFHLYYVYYILHPARILTDNLDM